MRKILPNIRPTNVVDKRGHVDSWGGMIELNDRLQPLFQNFRRVKVFSGLCSINYIALSKYN